MWLISRTVVPLNNMYYSTYYQTYYQHYLEFVSKSEIGGTGLGLFISKSIIESHGRKIWTKNNKDNGGATFSFSLPLAINNERNSSSNDSSRLS